MAMAWIDYRKAYDMLPHSWILGCLKELGVNEEIRRLLEETMKSWRVELTCAQEVLGEVKIMRGIFQGDSLPPLLFVSAMIPPTHILRKSPNLDMNFLVVGKRLIIYYIWTILSCTAKMRKN